ncbi:hypothetical protein [Prochlorothrix hollandica]|uniref:hypothetical protein n=1 Tax=Prochlorothrix hollandica TaxID=1223 RepID=UPI00333F3C43
MVAPVLVTALPRFWPPRCPGFGPKRVGTGARPLPTPINMVVAAEPNDSGGGKNPTKDSVPHPLG